jgi:hypothetical protein
VEVDLPGDGGARMENLEARTIRKVSTRLIGFLMICYFITYLDRSMSALPRSP